MWMSSEDARSDFVLAAAALIFGSMLTAFLTTLPIYPGGLFGLLLVPVWITLLMTTWSRFLAKNRGQGLEGHGLGADRSGLTDGLLLVLPIVVTGYAQGFSPLGVTGALLGTLGPGEGPTVASFAALTFLFKLLVFVASLLGTVLLYGLLVTRSRDAFREVDMPLLEALRSYGLGALGLGTVMGLLLSLGGGGPRALHVLLNSGALLLTILITDRMVASSDRTSRATILAPAITVLVAFVLASGGLFGGGLPNGLYRGGTAAATMVVFATLLQTRRGAWAVVPLVAATLWAPTCGVLPVAYLLTTTGGC